MTGKMLALGLMSGTSMDGVDVALIETDGEKVYNRGPGATYPYPGAIRDVIAAAVTEAASSHGRPDRTAVLREAEDAVTHSHIEAVKNFLAANHVPPARVGVVGFHGQTVLHRPDQGFSLQLGDGERLADAVGIDVVYDFRAADIAAGGQGGPARSGLSQGARCAGRPPPATGRGQYRWRRQCHLDRCQWRSDGVRHWPGQRIDG
jgi:anhydro-N-acetylmuramic acid kinase